MAFFMTAKVIGSSNGDAASDIHFLHLNRYTARPSWASSAPGRDYDRGVITLDDCRAHDNSGLRHSARQDARRNARRATAERNKSLAFLRRKCSRIEIQRCEFQSRCGLSDRGKAQVDELQRLSVSDIAECLLVGSLKGGS